LQRGKNTVAILKRQKCWPLRKKWMEDLMQHGLQRAGFRRAELSVLLTDNQEIKKLNAQYRNQNNATDCLSFPMQGTFTPFLKENRRDALVLGDIVIAIPFARREAVRMGLSFKKEMAWLLVHSLLHLLGFDHETVRQAKEMRRLEKEYLCDFKERHLYD